MKCRRGKPNGTRLVERPTDLSGVVDVDDTVDCHSVHRLGTFSLGTIYALRQHPGCFVVRGALHPRQQQDLMAACLTDYLQSPVVTNLGSNIGDQMKTMMMMTNGNNCVENRILRRLRWASLGPRFDWTRRVYERGEKYVHLPPLLKELAIKLLTSIHEVLQSNPISKTEPFENVANDISRLCIDSNNPSSYVPEAALINYYHVGDTLGGHIDDAEPNCSLPLVSLSLGCPAIFLMGGQTRDVPPTALLLRSGDAVVLAGTARKSFHGVPRILKDAGGKSADCSFDCSDRMRAVENYMQNCRINISIRALGSDVG